MPLHSFHINVKVVSIKLKGLTMAEQIKNIEIELHRYEYGLDNGLITQKEYDELTSLLTFELKLLARQV